MIRMEVLMEFKHMPMNGANYTDADIKRLIAEYNVQFIKLQLYPLSFENSSHTSSI